MNIFISDGNKLFRYWESTKSNTEPIELIKLLSTMPPISELNKKITALFTKHKGGVMTTDKVDTWSTATPVCPHCLHAHRDAWEMNEGQEGDWEQDCHHCDTTFLCSRNVNVTYYTNKKPKPGPPDAKEETMTPESTLRLTDNEMMAAWISTTEWQNKEMVLTRYMRSVADAQLRKALSHTADAKIQHRSGIERRTPDSRGESFPYNTRVGAERRRNTLKSPDAKEEK